MALATNASVNLGDRIYVRDSATMGPQTLVAFVSEIITPEIFRAHVFNPYAKDGQHVRVEQFNVAELFSKWMDTPPLPPTPPPAPSQMLKEYYDAIKADKTP